MKVKKSFQIIFGVYFHFLVCGHDMYFLHANIFQATII